MAVVASILAGKSPRREVPDLLSWVTSFSTYASILSEKYPQLTKGLWAYQTFIVREARRCGGHGWQEYDLMFRQQATATSLKWDTVNSSLYHCNIWGSVSKGSSCTDGQEPSKISGRMQMVPGARPRQCRLCDCPAPAVKRRRGGCIQAAAEKHTEASSAEAVFLVEQWALPV